VAAPTDEALKSESSTGRIRREVIIDAWIRLGRCPVSAKMLSEIQQTLSEKFGPDRVESPAFIARLLADEGAELRHPDLIEFDAHWREAKLSEASRNSITRDPVKPLTLRSAALMLRRFENLRQRLTVENNKAELRRLRDLALNEKARAQLLALDGTLRQRARKAQAEIAQWFLVWLQTPEIFGDWLDLRQRSREFREAFPKIKFRRVPLAQQQLDALTDKHE